MKNKTIGAFIYYQANVEPEGITNMLSRVEQVAGVVKAGINPNVKQLIDVEYEPQQVSTCSIIDVVQQSGFRGALVGM